MRRAGGPLPLAGGFTLQSFTSTVGAVAFAEPPSGVSALLTGRGRTSRGARYLGRCASRKTTLHAALARASPLPVRYFVSLRLGRVHRRSSRCAPVCSSTPDPLQLDPQARGHAAIEALKATGRVDSVGNLQGPLHGTTSQTSRRPGVCISASSAFPTRGSRTRSDSRRSTRSSPALATFSGTRRSSSRTIQALPYPRGGQHQPSRLGACSNLLDASLLRATRSATTAGSSFSSGFGRGSDPVPIARCSTPTRERRRPAASNLPAADPPGCPLAPLQQAPSAAVPWG